MITNELEYRITKAELARFEEGLIAHDAREPSPNVDPGMSQLMRDAITSEIEVLRGQIHHYEQLRDGRITGCEITSLHELPTALIEARIAARLTQRQLAERIGVVEQQIQCWEANEYTGVNLDRLQGIADALGVQIHETITYSSAEHGGTSLHSRGGATSCPPPSASSAPPPIRSSDGSTAMLASRTSTFSASRANGIRRPPRLASARP